MVTAAVLFGFLVLVGLSVMVPSTMGNHPPKPAPSKTNGQPKKKSPPPPKGQTTMVLTVMRNRRPRPLLRLFQVLVIGVVATTVIAPDATLSLLDEQFPELFAAFQSA